MLQIFWWHEVINLNSWTGLSGFRFFWTIKGFFIFSGIIRWKLLQIQFLFRTERMYTTNLFTIFGSSRWFMSHVYSFFFCFRFQLRSGITRALIIYKRLKYRIWAFWQNLVPPFAFWCLSFFLVIFRLVWKLVYYFVCTLWK